MTPRSSKPFPLCPGPLEARQHPFPNTFPLELRQRRQDVELEFPGGRCAVDALAQADEGNAQAGEILQHRHQMPEVPPEPVQPPAHQHVKPPSFRIPEQRIQRRPPVLGAAHTTVHELRAGPAPGGHVTP
jgi:hypothetical protein